MICHPVGPHRASHDGEISAMIQPSNVRQARLTDEGSRHMICFLSTQAAALANATAALNCAGEGAQGGLPTRAELQQFLASP